MNFLHIFPVIVIFGVFFYHSWQVWNKKQIIKKTLDAIRSKLKNAQVNETSIPASFYYKNINVLYREIEKASGMEQSRLRLLLSEFSIYSITDSMYDATQQQYKEAIEDYNILFDRAQKIKAQELAVRDLLETECENSKKLRTLIQDELHTINLNDVYLFTDGVKIEKYGYDMLKVTVFKKFPTNGDSRVYDMSQTVPLDNPRIDEIVTYLNGKLNEKYK